jgi:aminopeptidase N
VNDPGTRTSGAGLRRAGLGIVLVVLLVVALLVVRLVSGGEESPAATPPEPGDPALEVAESEPVEDPYYPEVGDPGVDVLHYDLDLSWDRESLVLDGDAGLTLRATAAADELRLDLGEPLEVSDVRLDDAEVDWVHEGKDLVVRAPVQEDRQYVLEVAYAGVPEPVPAPTRRRDIDGLGWTVSEHGEVWTLQEPYGAYTWYPVHDHPSDKALYDVEISVPAPWVGVSGGELVSREEVDGRTVTRFEMADPVASYLVTIAIGDYVHETDETASGVPLHYWVPRRSRDRLERVRASRDALEWAEEKLGAYPFDTAGTLVVDSESGMETQTLITLGDTDYALGDEVLVHEMVHQWWGDQVTPEDWTDLWMNEGMAMYLQGVFRSEYGIESIDEVAQTWREEDQELRDASGPPGAYDPDRFGDRNVYYGSALMWHALRRQVGEEDFWRVVREWPAANAGGNASREEWLAWTEEQTGEDLDPLVDAWLLGETTPAQ